MKPKNVAVVVPVYNVENYIRQCLESVLAQSYEDVELILVDDCGGDKSMEIAAEIKDSYKGKKRITIVTREKNGGLAAARNSGVAAARNSGVPFIYFLDSDDYLRHTDAIAKLVARQEETQADLVTANSMMFDDKTGQVYQVVDKDYEKGFHANQGSTPDLRLGGVAWNKLIRSDFIAANDLMFDEGVVWEDTVWVFKLMCSSPSIATLADRTYAYRFRQGSIMNTMTYNHIFSRAMLPLLAFKWLRKHGTSKRKYALDAIEDMKHGAMVALHKLGHDELGKQLLGLYKQNLTFDKRIRGGGIQKPDFKSHFEQITNNPSRISRAVAI